MILKDIEINMFLINIAKRHFLLPMLFGAKKVYIPSYVYVATDYVLAYITAHGST